MENRARDGFLFSKEVEQLALLADHLGLIRLQELLNRRVDEIQFHIAPNKEKRVYANLVGLTDGYEEEGALKLQQRSTLKQSTEFLFMETFTRSLSNFRVQLVDESDSIERVMDMDPMSQKPVWTVEAQGVDDSSPTRKERMNNGAYNFDGLDVLLRCAAPAYCSRAHWRT